MGSNTYVVRLIDCQKGAGGVEGNAADVLAKLKAWYTSVCQKASSGNTTWTADVQWLDQPPSNLPGQNAGSPLTINLILFFVPSPRSSVITLHPKFKKKVDLKNFGGVNILEDTSVKGLTAIGKPRGSLDLAVSEVYVTRCRDTSDAETQQNFARTAFHEGMHNQLYMDDDMHRGGTGFRSAEATGDSPNADNLRDMAAKIGTLTQQWLDGFQAWKSNQDNPMGQ
jgi:hypothetical protein